MAVSSGNDINAADYNGLQSRIANILGNGSGTSGYGQSLASSQVSVGTTITAAQMDNLRTDINKAFAHQDGSNSTLGDIQAGNIIGADGSNSGSTAGVGTDNIDDATKGFNDYLTTMTTVENNKFTADATQVSIENAITSSRATPWNGTITHEFTVTFGSADNRRHFFNSGGEIWFTAELTGGTTSKDTDWATILTNMGTIKFAYTSTTSTGTGTGTTVGNFDLTGTYQTIFTKAGSASVYAENEYEIRARQDSASVIRFQVRFEDNDTGDQQPANDTGAGGDDGPDPAGPGEDENVGGTLTSTIRQRRATGSNVAVTGPAYSNTSTL